MNRCVQILLVIALVTPWSGSAREETMEERKRRIMRKYLREQGSLSDVNLPVAGENLEDEQVADSERFKQPQVDFERHESGTPMPRPSSLPRRPVPVAEDRNWLLAEDPMAEDPFADPFDISKQDPAGDGGSLWEQRKDEARERFRKDEAYGGSRNDERRGSDRYVDERNRGRSGLQGFADPRSQPPGSGYRNDRKSSYSGSHSEGMRREDTPASRFEEERPPAFSTSRDTGMFSRFSTSPGSRSSGRSPEQSRGRDQGLIPYQSREKSSPFGGPSGAHQPKQDEFKRVNPYTKWKEENNSWDPMKDNRSLDEMIPRDRFR
jgi:hypothetical protein